MAPAVNRFSRNILASESSLRISLEVGYNSVQYFGKLFKKKTGISPGTFRKNMGKDVAV